MTDWNLGQRGDIAKIALAREIGLDGHSSQRAIPDGRQARRCAIRKRRLHFKRAALENGIQICSLAIGNPGNRGMPMHTSPAFAILLAEAVEIAYNIGTNNILLPILGDSHIDMTNQAQVDTFVAMMKEVARYAEKYDVVVGLEDWISARGQHQAARCHRIGLRRRLLRRPQHRAAHNTDIYAEPKLLGKRISQIHVKNANNLLETPGGKMDWPRMAKEFYDIGYRGWYVLETGSPTKDIVADTRANIAYVKKTFRVPQDSAATAL